MDGETISLQMDNPLSPCLIQESDSPGIQVRRHADQDLASTSISEQL